MYLRLDLDSPSNSAIVGVCKQPIRLTDLLSLPLQLLRKLGMKAHSL